MVPAKRLARAGLLLIALVAALTGCSAGTSSTEHASPTATIRATATPSAAPAPTRYTARLVLRGGARPDDLAFDRQGRLLFSDFYNGTVIRLEPDGSVTVLLRGLAGPEGLVVLADGTLIVAEQRTNRILSVAPGSAAPRIIRALPGTPAGPPCKDGVDGIALDPTNNALIVPDSPAGEVYRMNPDGGAFTLVASGIVRPVGAAVDAQGTIYVADECGGAVWRIPTAGEKTKIGGFTKPDDVGFDPQGNLLVIDLGIGVHALIRVNLATGQRETLARDGFAEPQGLAVDARGDVFVSDDAANVIVEYTPA
jgi:sugar lactone lactonase YvrE